jgi:tRNA U34 2-thiouridine synthase MnmA/TrmU
VNIDGEFFIKKGKYLNKEQSYFLSRLPKRNASIHYFSLGDTSKQEIEIT